MAMVRKRHASVLAASLLSAVLAACAEESMLSPQPVSMGGTPGSAGLGGASAGSGAGSAAGAGAGASGGTSGGAGMTSIGMAGRGMAGMGGAGMMGAAGTMMTAGSGGGGACANPSADTDSDGTPDCMDMCPMDEAKTVPGMCGCGTAETTDCMDTPEDPSACAVGPITDEVRSTWRLDPFYTRYGNAEGIPIVATDNPEDEAIRRACRVVMDLSSKVPNARETMRNNRVYFIMMAKTEKTVQTPEYRSRGDLDARARGFGNNPGLCAEENVMCDRTTDRWRGESICVHEYAHVMHLYVWNRTDPQFNSKVNAAYNNAVRTMGLYRNTYAASNATEYLGEIVQNWYNTNLEASASGNGVHNHINTREELKEYDPMGYALLEQVLPDVPAYKDCYYYE